MIIKSKLLITILFLTIFLGANAQEIRFKEFADSHKERAFCFYPSTLRMLNIGGDPDFNEMVGGIEKLLVYKLDSISSVDKLYLGMIKDFKSIGFEEFMAVNGGGNEISLLGNEQKSITTFVGVFVNDEISLAFFMKGNIKWEEIPKMIQNIKEGDFINILDLKSNQGEKHHRN